MGGVNYSMKCIKFVVINPTWIVLFLPDPDASSVYESMGQENIIWRVFLTSLRIMRSSLELFANEIFSQSKLKIPSILYVSSGLLGAPIRIQASTLIPDCRF